MQNQFGTLPDWDKNLKIMVKRVYQILKGPEKKSNLISKWIKQVPLAFQEIKNHIFCNFILMYPLLRSHKKINLSDIQYIKITCKSIFRKTYPSTIEKLNSDFYM